MIKTVSCLLGRDQLARKSFWFRRSLRDGLSQGFDRQFYRGPSSAGGLRAGGRDRCRDAADRCKARAIVG